MDTQKLSEHETEYETEYERDSSHLVLRWLSIETVSSTKQSGCLKEEQEMIKDIWRDCRTDVVVAGKHAIQLAIQWCTATGQCE